MLQIKEEDSNRNAIVVVGYNRIKSITRLLNSLLSAEYSEEVPLVISIDCSGDTEVYQKAIDFEWPFGNKYVNIQTERLGLKNHIYFCGGLSEFFKSVTILEDDLYVSKCFYKYVSNAVEEYGQDGNIAGISLYKNEHNGFNSLPMTFLKDGADVFAYQSTGTWGETFTWQMWQNFTLWLSSWDEDFSKVDMYQEIKRWKKAWSKYYEAYIILNNKYFIYPFLSVCTNFSDAGTHVSNDIVSNAYQVELLFKSIDYRMPAFENLLKYDTYAQFIGIDKYIGGKVIMDLYGNRENIIYKDNYVLSVNVLPYKIIKSFGIRLRPIELNVIYGIEGEGIYLYDTSQYGSNRDLPNPSLVQADYYLRSFDFRKLSRYCKSYIVHKIYGKIKKIFKA